MLQLTKYLKNKNQFFFSFGNSQHAFSFTVLKFQSCIHGCKLKLYLLCKLGIKCHISLSLYTFHNSLFFNAEFFRIP